jgi:hypothetical protein
MAYNAISRPAQEMMAAPAPAGTLSARPEAIPRPARQDSAAVRVTHRESGALSNQAEGATTALLRFLILLVAICGLTCLYVWQANTISSIRGDTRIMLDDIQNLERQNVQLMLQYSPWDAPSYIEAESSGSGMVAGQVPVRIELPAEFQAGKDTSTHTDPIRQIATLLVSSLTLGSRVK